MLQEINLEFDQSIFSATSSNSKTQIDKYWIAFYENEMIGTSRLLLQKVFD